MEAALLASKRAEHRDLKQRALALTDTAISEDRQLTTDEAKQLDDLVEQAKALGDEIEGARIGASPELMKQLEDLSHRPEAWDHVDRQTGGMKVALGETLAVKAASVSHPWALAIERASRQRGEKAFRHPPGRSRCPPCRPSPSRWGCSALRSSRRLA